MGAEVGRKDQEEARRRDRSSTWTLKQQKKNQERNSVGKCESLSKIFKERIGEEVRSETWDENSKKIKKRLHSMV